MNTLVLFCIRKIYPLIPDTRGYRLKSLLLRLAGARIGQNVRICSTVKIIGDSQLIIGDNTFIGHDSIIICSAPIIIGKNVNIAPRCYIGTGTHDIDINGDSVAGKGKSLPISISDGVWVCASSSLLAGTVVGEKSIIAAGAVVKGEVDSHELVGGVLAKHIKYLE